ncbi:hypothetical protein AJ80_08821 [Polytolypa hystricis UAMH7299]|uniref:F-box domain-containing protein n=1 Tax=Polytolypa hystricis (strain UAMH7299) TaxID=1447883 RepID=A0A2B7X143_POLH7|nr:hypothetical protein AJ80_08821 [Polytolypa hystricis UAMH7299]
MKVLLRALRSCSKACLSAPYQLLACIFRFRTIPPKDSFSTVPTEIMEMIADNLNTKELTYLGLACRRFRSVVEPRLLKTVDITSHTKAYGLALVLKNDQRQQNTKTLKISKLSLGGISDRVQLLKFVFSRLLMLNKLEISAAALLEYRRNTRIPLAKFLPSQLQHLHVEEHAPRIEDVHFLRRELVNYIRTKPRALGSISVSTKTFQGDDRALKEIYAKMGVKVIVEHEDPERDAWGNDCLSDSEWL